MKKIYAILVVFGMLLLVVSASAIAQDEAAEEEPQVTTLNEEETEEVTVEEEVVAMEEEPQERSTLHKQIKAKFIEGGASFMGFILLCLIFGLALAIERIIYLSLATTNTDKLLEKIEDALESGGVEAAKEVCRNTRGPVASIFYQGLDRIDHGIDVVEKSIISYGSVQTGLLEKNLSWISLFISIAPMLGFMGTVIGMIMAFESIQQHGDVNASIVAGPIGVALITTASGLIVAVVLQLFYNYLITKIDGIVNNMEDASISLIDLLIKYNLKK
ncbi:MAG: MotA/TolQ/ExbB proton channel family protein [Bacteroidales bacterium]|nr:MAG: MotA/TolQ/ExbB proton channel family protein [Bacteroidales bacterium]